MSRLRFLISQILQISISQFSTVTLALSLAYIMSALEGAAKLALRRDDWPEHFDFSESGFWLSFSAMLWAAPLQLWQSVSSLGIAAAVQRGARQGVHCARPASISGCGNRDICFGLDRGFPFLWCFCPA